METKNARADHQPAQPRHPGMAPAAGYWTCRPAEFWASFNIKFVKATQYAFALLAAGAAWFAYRLISVDSASLWLQIIFAAALFGLIYLVTAFVTERKIARHDSKSFHVVIEFDSVSFDAVRGGDLIACTKFGKGTAFPQDEESSGLSSNEAVALQNLLPRLYELQRAGAGNDGLLQVAAPDSKTWIFRYRRGPLKQASIVLLSIVVAILAGELTFQFLDATLPSLAAGAGVALALIHYVRAPGRLKLLVCVRDNGNVVDVHWQDRRGLLHETHTHWASLGNAKPLTEFCEYLVSFQSTLKLQLFSVDEPNLEPENTGHDHSHE